MDLRDSYRNATRSIAGARMRSFLTMLGIIIGIAAVILLMAVGEGSKRNILGQIQGSGSGKPVPDPGSAVEHSLRPQQDDTGHGREDHDGRPQGDRGQGDLSHCRLSSQHDRHHHQARQYHDGRYWNLRHGDLLRGQQPDHRKRASHRRERRQQQDAQRGHRGKRELDAVSGRITGR